MIGLNIVNNLTLSIETAVVFAASGVTSASRTRQPSPRTLVSEDRSHRSQRSIDSLTGAMPQRDYGRHQFASTPQQFAGYGVGLVFMMGIRQWRVSAQGSDFLPN
jgi:hypothetical protein